jgi:hypothetical protein
MISKGDLIVEGPQKITEIYGLELITDHYFGCKRPKVRNSGEMAPGRWMYLRNGGPKHETHGIHVVLMENIGMWLRTLIIHLGIYFIGILMKIHHQYS